MSDEVELKIAWASVAPASQRSAEVFEDLVSRHRQTHRRYHGLRHVVWVLRHTRRLEAAIPECEGDSTPYDGAAVTAAACFHDAVYDPRADDNEARSALLATHQLASVGWSERRCALVAGLIEATAGHLADDEGAISGEAVGGAATLEHGVLERGVLLDADLGVLGSEPSAYAAYVNGVRAEYGHLTAEQWVTGRAAVLQRLHGRAHLYATEPARAWWEQRARANLTAELAGLARSERSAR
ncbi:MAG: HD domain-containing protein [Acidimicrobiales bacterium]